MLSLILNKFAPNRSPKELQFVVGRLYNSPEKIFNFNKFDLFIDSLFIENDFSVILDKGIIYNKKTHKTINIPTVKNFLLFVYKEVEKLEISQVQKDLLIGYILFRYQREFLIFYAIKKSCP